MEMMAVGSSSHDEEHSADAEAMARSDTWDGKLANRKQDLLSHQYIRASP